MATSSRISRDWLLCTVRYCKLSRISCEECDGAAGHLSAKQSVIRGTGNFPALYSTLTHETATTSEDDASRGVDYDSSESAHEHAIRYSTVDGTVRPPHRSSDPAKICHVSFCAQFGTLYRWYSTQAITALQYSRPITCVHIASLEGNNKSYNGQTNRLEYLYTVFAPHGAQWYRSVTFTCRQHWQPFFELLYHVTVPFEG